MTDNNTSTPVIKPLATKIDRPHLPHFEEMQGEKKPFARRVSNLRVNRTLFYPGKHKEEKPEPIQIRGEKQFEPSEDLKSRLERIRRAQENLPEIPESALDTSADSEKRERQLSEARRAYQEQLEKLRAKEEHLKQARTEAAQQLADLHQKVGEDHTSKTENLQELIGKQEQRVQELERSQESLENQLERAREIWQEKIDELKTIRDSDLEDQEKSKQLGEQIHQQQERINQFKQRRDELAQQLRQEESELERLKEVIGVLKSQNKEQESLIKHQREQLEELRKDKEKISRFANDLVRKLAQVENLQRVEDTITVSKKQSQPQEEYEPQIIKDPPLAEDIPELTDKPNAISGIVYNATREPVAHALVIVKDQNGNPQRALRTDKLGQFAVSSPLPDGVYRIEVQKEDLNFDIIELKLSGEKVDPIRIEAVSLNE